VGPIVSDIHPEDLYGVLSRIADSHYGSKPDKSVPGAYTTFLEHPTRLGETKTVMELRPERRADGYRNLVITIENPKEPSVNAVWLRQRLNYIIGVIQSSELMRRENHQSLDRPQLPHLDLGIFSQHATGSYGSR
jgi:hypothetical protein